MIRCPYGLQSRNYILIWSRWSRRQHNIISNKTVSCGMVQRWRITYMNWQKRNDDFISWVDLMFPWVEVLQSCFLLWEVRDSSEPLGSCQSCKNPFTIPSADRKFDTCCLDIFRYRQPLLSVFPAVWHFLPSRSPRSVVH